MSVKRNLLLTLMALFIGGAILYYQYRPLPAPVDVTWADAQQEGRTRWLSSHHHPGTGGALPAGTS